MMVIKRGNKNKILDRLIKMKELAFIVTCLYSLAMSLVVVLMMHHHKNTTTMRTTYDVDFGSRHFSIGGGLDELDKSSSFSNVLKDLSNNSKEMAQFQQIDVTVIEEEEDVEDVEEKGAGYVGQNASVVEVLEVVVPAPENNETTSTGYYFLDDKKPFKKRCGRCSLVSSGGHLYQSGAGREIDSADCVLRMNTAAITGWTHDVGSRTDIRIIGQVNVPRGLVKKKELRTEILGNQKTRTKYIVVPWLYREEVNMLTHPTVKIARGFQKKYPKVKFVFLTKEKQEESEERYKLETGFPREELQTWFSTGYVAMMFALDVCDSVQVYGLSNVDFCRKHPKSSVPYHYYEPKKRTECAYQNKNELGHGHKFMTERAMFARWSLIYNLTFHHPPWKADIENASASIDTPFLRKYREALKKGKLKDAPHYVFKNGKRFRVVHRRVRRVDQKPMDANNASDTKQTNDTVIEGQKENGEERREVKDDILKPEKKSDKQRHPGGQSEDKNHVHHKVRKIIVRRVVRRKPVPKDD